MNLDARRRAWLMLEGSSLFRHYRSLRLPLSPKTQKSTGNRCFFHALTEIRCRQNFPFFLTGEAQHIDTPYLEVPVRFNMPIYAFLHNVLLVRKLNLHTKLQCSKTNDLSFDVFIVFNIHTKLQCSKTLSSGSLRLAQFNIHTKLQCSKTCSSPFSACNSFNIHTKLQCSKT